MNSVFCCENYKRAAYPTLIVPTTNLAGTAHLQKHAVLKKGGPIKTTIMCPPPVNETMQIVA